MQEASPSTPFDAALVRQLDVAVTQAQREWRSPGLSVGLARDGHLVYTRHVGVAATSPRRAPDDDTQFMMGSITKTFTAILVMQLRDEGRLDLHDPLGRHLPELAHGSMTVHQLLSHASGIQREPVGHIWETLRTPDSAEILAGVAEAERVLRPYEQFHYSNLAYAVLGAVVERVRGQSWETAVHERILTPLGMHRTGLRPGDGHAVGYLVHPYAGTAAAEPMFDLRGGASLGGLWTTVADLCRYGAFIADPDPSVLAPETLTEMTRPVVIVDPQSWTLGYGLSWSMARRGERIYTGHGGAMPGFLAGLRVSRCDRLAAVAFANTTAGAQPLALAGDLLDLVLDVSPTVPATWEPEAPSDALTPLLGAWWSEGTALEFSIRDGELWASIPGEPARFGDTRFAPDGEHFRAVEGRERGERLEVVRDATGAVVKLYFATYAVTRDPKSFAELSSDTARG
ncbi:MAG TPA: serine hydrolase domain-containing protein [Dermatophilaceae bacterium]|jgi:CubicO group peptidase (beta-lactamase class C family)|nr:serine hydrolase domain-containing protein [Dermatophilaceae bacterium]